MLRFYCFCPRPYPPSRILTCLPFGYILGLGNNVIGKKVIMGLLSFLKNIFAGEDKDEAELDAARARHGITVDKKEMDKTRTEAERFGEEYDVWEELKYIRASFFIGGWAAKKFHIIGEDKVRKDLEKLDRKRKEEEESKKGEG